MARTTAPPPQARPVPDLPLGQLLGTLGLPSVPAVIDAVRRDLGTAVYIGIDGLPWVEGAAALTYIAQRKRGQQLHRAALDGHRDYVADHRDKRIEAGQRAYAAEYARLAGRYPKTGMSGVAAGFSTTLTRDPILEDEIRESARRARHDAEAQYDQERPLLTFEQWTSATAHTRR